MSKQLDIYIYICFFLLALTKIYSEEIYSKSTKDARITNMKIFNDTDDKKPVIDRKIDLILVSMSLEVSCSEWMKDNTSPALVEQRQIKNCHTNSSILHDLKKLPIIEKEKEDMFVLGMEWIGMFTRFVLIMLI